MDAAAREIARSRFAQRLSDDFEACSLTKADLLAAVNATDQWVEDNKASFNSALPAAAQSGLTAAQKAELMVFVVRRRWEVGA
jgi:hypothetical protein